MGIVNPLDSPNFFKKNWGGEGGGGVFSEDQGLCGKIVFWGWRRVGFEGSHVEVDTAGLTHVMPNFSIRRIQENSDCAAKLRGYAFLPGSHSRHIIALFRESPFVSFAYPIPTPLRGYRVR
jgi:hypothetical protein